MVLVEKINPVWRYVIKERSEDLSHTQRSQIVWAILNRTRFENSSAADKVGIQRLIAKNVYKAAYPLHDGNYDYHDKAENSMKMNERRVNMYPSILGFWYSTKSVEREKYKSR